MERMTALDAAFYFNERRRTPLHIGSVTVLEGPAPKFTEFTDLIRERLPLLPRYRQRVRTVPLGLGPPVWVDDTRFDLERHLRHTALPKPGGPGELHDIAARILAWPLDLKHPPWELWLVEGLSEGRWAIISKIHHCVVDGVGAADLMTALFDLDAESPSPGRPSEWAPEHEPSPPRVILDALRANLTEPVRRLGHGLREPSLARQAAVFASGLPRSIRRVAHQAPPALRGPLGPHRHWEWFEIDLDEVRAVRAAHGGTVNDVILAAVTHGFREFLQTRGELTEHQIVRSMVPVSVRGDGERGLLTNRVSAVVVALPCGEADPLRRLFLLRQQMDDLKRSHQQVSGEVVTHLAELAPAVLAALSRAAFNVAGPLFETVITNVPGPPIPLYIRGRRVHDLYPYVPIASGVRVSVGVVSYLGRLYFGVTADADLIPDLPVLTKGIQAGFEELVHHSQPPPLLSDMTVVRPATDQSP